MMEILVGGAEVMVALAWSTTEGLKRRAIPPPRTGSRAASSVGLRVGSAAGVGEGAAAGGDTKRGIKSESQSILNHRQIQSNFANFAYLERQTWTVLHCWFSGRRPQGLA